VAPLKKETAGIIAQRKPLATVSTTLSSQELSNFDKSYKDKVAALDALLKQRLFITPKFDYIPKLIPDGIWLTSLNFSKDETSLLIEGAAFLEDSAKEINAINTFVEKLKANEEFSKTFNIIIASSQREGMIRDIRVTFFTINCRKK
ncbi:MAG: PilN domain-containing protein, partial [Candidatus Omnitrophica bacterium]|nr:PilN domain-containing protein [Candidatus Omnitrophota bacterium]